MSTTRQRALEAIVVLMQTIQVANQFQTDAGHAVFLGETPQLGEDDPTTAIAVVPQETRPGAHRFEVLAVEIQAVAKAALEQPYLAAETALSDIVQAMEGPDRTIGGLVKWVEIGATRLLPREPGSTTVGVGQIYELTFVRQWGTA